jgi:hypothetical protein
MKKLYTIIFNTKELRQMIKQDGWEKIYFDFREFTENCLYSMKLFLEDKKNKNCQEWKRISKD